MVKSGKGLSTPQHYQRLLQARKLGSLEDFSQVAQEENQKRLENIDSSGKTRATVARQDLQRSRAMWKELNRERRAVATKARQTIIPKVKPKEDGIYLIIFMVSVLADLLTLVPVVGGGMAILVIPVIWILYLVAGHFRKRWGLKVTTNMVTQVTETLGVGLNALPFYTVNAFVNYLIVLYDRQQKDDLK